MNRIKKIVFTILTIPLFGSLFFLGRSILSEGLNPIKPDIDTKFTSEFKNEKFDLLEIRMDSLDVTKLIGEPFSIQELTDNNTLWYFTGDGKCNWYDFAWLGREIKFDENGKVIQIIKSVHYD